ncbi:hypothetical protein J4218_02475 [Candidatus Pacearchaeota archaeon]|nr:hypothetical protein [Candidatus Pacearchaeota archaeon]
MKIVGFGLTSISGERKEGNGEKLTLNQNIEIMGISKEKVPISSEEVLNLKFLFSIKYSGDLGKVEIGGSVLIIPDKDESKEFQKAIKEKSIPEKAKPILFNFIMTKCNIKALSLEDDLNLPYHVALPKLTINKDKID